MSGRRRTVVAVALAAMIIGAAVVWFRPDPDPDVEVAVDEDGDADEGVLRVPEVGFLLPRAPDDGKDSLMLPVSAEPATGLVTGQEVVVRGSGFPPSTSIGVVMCAKEAGQEHGGHGVDACDLRGVTQTTSDSEGRVVASHPVRRLLLIAGQELDCAEAPDRCMVAMGAISDYDQSGGALVSFDPTEPLPPAPTVRTSSIDALVDGDAVRVQVDGLRVRTGVYIDQCDVGLRSCTGVLETETETDANGTLEFEAPVWRQLPGVGHVDNIDCASEGCVLRINAESPEGRVPALISLRFDPAGPARRAPRAVVEPSGPYAAGDRFTVRLPGGDPRSYGLTVEICRGDECVVQAEAGPSDRDVVDGFVDAALAERCVDGCVLHVRQWSEWRSGEPPPLHAAATPFETRLG